MVRRAEYGEIADDKSKGAKGERREIAGRAPRGLRIRIRKKNPGRDPIVPHAFVDWIDEGGVRQARFSPKLLRVVRGLSLDISPFCHCSDKLAKLYGGDDADRVAVTAV